MNGDYQFVEALIYRCHQVYQRMLATAAGGNLSLRLPPGDRFLITTTGSNLGDIGPHDVVVVDASGKVVQGEGKPSRETSLHLGIYRVRPDVGAVVHHHAPTCVAFACHGQSIPLLTGTGKRNLGPRIPLVPPAPSGSPELAAMVTEAYRDPEVKVAFLEDHGVVVAAADIETAYNLADLVEDQAKVGLAWLQLEFIKRGGAAV